MLLNNLVQLTPETYYLFILIRGFLPSIYIGFIFFGGVFDATLFKLLTVIERY